MTDTTRRQFVSTVPAGLIGAFALAACSAEPEAEARRADPLAATQSTALSRELVRCATLAPSSHNTQCWKFAVEDRSITILPDLLRRCPAVDPDDHHVFVSLGCAAENLVQAALAHGLQAEVVFDAQREAVRVSLAPTPALATPLFNAIPLRQCTRGDYDGKPLSNDELRQLERAGTSVGVNLLLLTQRAQMDVVLDHVLLGNTAQMADPAFVKELKAWLRFNGSEAARTRDGLYSVVSGNPALPTWLGGLAFDWLFTAKAENDKLARQIRSSAGIAVFTGLAADKAHWVDVGRCCERFALQATAMGIRCAFVNQPVEVQSLRPQFAAAIGLSGRRPDLVMRFGRGPTLPMSLRRPVHAVIA